MTHKLASNENFDIVRGNQTVRVPFDATDPQSPTTVTMATKADATLTEGYSEWVIDVQSYPDGYTGHSELYAFSVGAWRIDWTGGPEILTTTIPGTADSLSLSLDDSGWFGHIAFSATRHPILTLGEQSDKPIQPAGDYLPKENVVAPSSSATAGQAADAKDTYDALDAKAPLDSPTFTGTPTAPDIGMSTTSQVATKNFVDGVIAGPSAKWLYLRSLEDDSTVSISKVSSAPDVSLEYSTNNGLEWLPFTVGSTTITLDRGNWVSFRATEEATHEATANDITQYNKFVLTGSVDVGGNIMSLLFHSDADIESATTLAAQNTFPCLFREATALHDASKLVLPATNLTAHCYREMFLGCTSLVGAPELPAMSLGESCYADMFQATKISIAPALPATRLANKCYQGMFYLCSRLETAPELPATELANECYRGLLRGCQALKVAPILPAATLRNGCYRDIFNGCANLKDITVDFTAFSGSNSTLNWVYGVAANGLIHCKTNIAASATGNSQMPSGWTVVIDRPYGSLGYSLDEPKVAGTASAGVALSAARSDHVHPSDASKADLVNGVVPASELPAATTEAQGAVVLASPSTAASASGKAADAKATGDKLADAREDIDALLFAKYYPDGSVKSAAEFTAGIKYDAPDTVNRTITVKPFCNTGDSDNDNSSLVGRVVIPPFVDGDGNGYITDDGTRFKVTAVAYGEVVEYNTNLTTIVAPMTVTSIGDRAFSYCTSLASIHLPAATSIENSVFDSCTSLSSVSLPAAQSIGGRAFCDCTSLASVFLPAATSIEPRTFAGCVSLSSIHLPAATNISINAFYGCTSLSSVSLPAATTIGDGAFSSCNALTSVDFGDMPRSDVPSLGNSAFQSVPNTCKIIVPDEQYDAWVAASGWSNLVTQGYQFLRHSVWEYARRYELADKAPINSPAFTGTPTVPDPTYESPITQAANISYVNRAVDDNSPLVARSFAVPVSGTLGDGSASTIYFRPRFFGMSNGDRLKGFLVKRYINVAAADVYAKLFLGSTELAQSRVLTLPATAGTYVPVEFPTSVSLANKDSQYRLVFYGTNNVEFSATRLTFYISSASPDCYYGASQTFIPEITVQFYSWEAFDDTPTAGSLNPVTSDGIAKAVAIARALAEVAEDIANDSLVRVKVATDDIAAVNEKIPSGASAQNQLVDTATMNSSIATNTATFRGTYNLVTDLELTVAATQEQIAVAISRKMEVMSISPDNNDYCFVQIPTKDETPTEISRVDRYKCVESEQGGTKVLTWEYEWSLNNSSFTAAQWAAINSGITSGAVAKLDALPTAQTLAQSLAGKLDKSGGEMTGPLTIPSLVAKVTNGVKVTLDYDRERASWYIEQKYGLTTSRVYLPPLDLGGFLITNEAMLDLVEEIAPAFTAKTYVLNELCSYDGGIYHCISAYTATAQSDTPEEDSTHWEFKPLSEIFAQIADVYAAVQQIAPAWVSGSAYPAYALCSYNGVVYQNGNTAIPSGTTTTPDTSSSGWTAKKVSDLFLPLTGGTMTGGLGVPWITFTGGGGAKFGYSSVNNGFQFDVDGVGSLLIRPGASALIELIAPKTDGTLALTALNPTAGNLASLDAQGNPTDSGKSLDDISQEIQDAIKYAVVVDDKLVPTEGPGTSEIYRGGAGTQPATPYLAEHLPAWTVSGSSYGQNVILRNRYGTSEQFYHYDLSLFTDRIVFWVEGKDNGDQGVFTRSIVFPKSGVYALDVEYAAGYASYPSAMGQARFIVDAGTSGPQDVIGVNDPSIVQHVQVQFAANAGAGSISVKGKTGLTGNACCVVIASVKVTLVKEIGIEIGDIVPPDASAQAGQAADAKATYDELNRLANALDGSSYDFSTNRGISRAVADIVRLLGGEVTNEPSENTGE